MAFSSRLHYPCALVLNFRELSVSCRVDQPESSVARNSLQAITVMATHHVSEVMKGGEGLSGHLALKPDIFVGILRTLLQVRPKDGQHLDSRLDCLSGAGRRKLWFLGKAFPEV